MIDEIEFKNEILIQSLKSLPMQGEYKAEIAMIPPMDGSSVKNTTGVLLLEDSEEVLEIPELVVDNFEENPQKMLLELSRFFGDYGVLPDTILFVGEDTRRLLAHYCLVMNIKLIPADMEGALLDFMQGMGGFPDGFEDEDYSDWEAAADEYELSDEERLEVMIQALMMFSDEEIQNMDDEFKNEAKDLLTLGAFPPELVPDIRRKLGLDGES